MIVGVAGMLQPHLISILIERVKNGESHVEDVEVFLVTFVPLIINDDLLYVFLLLDNFVKPQISDSVDAQAPVVEEVRAII